MFVVRMQLDTREAERQLTALEQRQIPFATSLALNNLTKKAQTNLRTHYGDVFELRRKDFIEKQGAKIFHFATKAEPFTVLGIDPKADFLSKFERGGTKLPTGGRLALAVPLNVKRNKRDIITRASRPRAFQFVRGQSSIATRITRYFGLKRTFMIQYADGRGWIFKRTGRGRSGRLFDGTSVLYTLQPSAQIDPLLEFVAIAERTANNEWSVIFEDAFRHAVQTAR